MIKLAEIFTDHMVLARDRKCVIFGESTDYSVEAFLDGEKVAETVFGEFEMTLPAHPAGGPHVLEIVAGPEKITLSDVWFGEVWLAGGQSNMEYLLCNDLEYEDAKKIADAPLLRQFAVPRAEYKNCRRDHPERFEKAPVWTVSTPETCGVFSDVCFWYGKKFTEKYGIPVGIVYCNVGGSSACAWVSRYTAATVPVVHEYVEDYERELRGQSFADYVKKYNDYYDYDRTWHEKAEELIRTEGLDAKTAYSDPRIGACPSWPPPNGPWHFSAPAHLYDAMLSTIIPYTLTKVLWYQGEEDVPHAVRYKELLRTMIAEWRRDFRNAELPFVLIQIAPYSYDWTDGLKGDAALVRAADVELSHELSNVSFVVTTNCGVQFDIHPPKKRILGERIFEQERSKIEDIPVIKSPELLDVKVVPGNINANGEKSDIIIILFDEPLAENPDIKGFMVSDTNNSVRFIKAETAGREKLCSGWAPFKGCEDRIVLIECEKSEDISEIRYAYADYIESTLYGKNGLPATPFKKLMWKA